ncbi:winged helix-turn-helix domain-containing protein [Prosthecobacter sp.]|uniref:winged helix-turn-helix domain-containing protein n=1 Tax=Prosthecobacter sp. TaxID=1965333 RepID=UPI003782FE28
MSAEPPIDFASLNTAVHGPIRLGVLTALATEESLDFTSLKRRLTVADGALGIHLQKLETSGYISSTKRFVGKRPNTLYQLTPGGRKALFEYLQTMQQLIDSLSAARLRPPVNPEHPLNPPSSPP